MFTELLCSRLIKATPSSQCLCGQHAVGARPPRALPQEPDGKPTCVQGQQAPRGWQAASVLPRHRQGWVPVEGWLGDHTAVHCPCAAMPKTPWENKAPSAFPVCSASFVSGCCGQLVGHEVLRHARAVPAACGWWPPGAPSEEQCFGVTAALGCLPCQEAPCSDAEGSKHPP